MSVELHMMVYRIECENSEEAAILDHKLVYDSDLKDFVSDIWRGSDDKFVYIETTKEVPTDMTSSEFVEFCQK